VLDLHEELSTLAHRRVPEPGSETAAGRQHGAPPASEAWARRRRAARPFRTLPPPLPRHGRLQLARLAHRRRRSSAGAKRSLTGA